MYKGHYPAQIIAEKYGCQAETIRRLWRGETYRSAPSFTPQEIGGVEVLLARKEAEIIADKEAEAALAAASLAKVEAALHPPPSNKAQAEALLRRRANERFFGGESDE